MRHNRTRGVSLIETVVYVVLFGILSMVVVQSLITATRSFNELRIDRDINDSAITVMERLTREIKNAQSIDMGVSQFGVSSSILKLNTTDTVGAPMTVQFSLSGGDLHVWENGADKGQLNSVRTTVDAFVLRLIANGNSVTVKIDLFVSGTRGPTTKQEIFYNSATTRDAY